MPVSEVVVFLPCHSLEDFPTHHEGAQAEGLLAAFTGVWRPEVIARCGKLPTQRRADEAVGEVEGRLLVIPGVCEKSIPPGVYTKAQRQGAVVVKAPADRQEVVAASLAAIRGDGLRDDLKMTSSASPSPSGRGQGEGGQIAEVVLESPLGGEPSEDGSPAHAAGHVDEDLAADFLALGYCYLQTQLLTRQMRYGSSLDEELFQQRVVAAARAAAGLPVENDPSAPADPNAPPAALSPKDRLQLCFDLLAEERDHYYPVDAYNIDLILTAETTLGESLTRELAGDSPSALMITGELLERLAETNPAALARIRQRLDAKTLTLVGGEYRESRLPLMSPEEVLAKLKAGLETYERLTGHRPTVYGRRTYGLTPLLPQTLAQLGFVGAIHASFDEGKVPEMLHARGRWAGMGAEEIDAVGKPPQDATEPGAFLAAATRLGEAMDMDHIATTLLAHYPGRHACYLNDWRRAGGYCAALGRFVTLQTYFEETSAAGATDRFSADQYTAPYLRADADAGRSAAIAQRRGREQSQLARMQAESLATMRILAGGALDDPLREPADALDPAPLAEALAAQPGPGQASPRGATILNPFSFARRSLVALPGLPALPDVEKPLRASVAGKGGDGQNPAPQVLVDLPPFGYVHASAGKGRGNSRPKWPLAERRKRGKDTTIIVRNEYFQAEIGLDTGAIAALYDYDHRSARLSQQIAFRFPQSEVALTGHEDETERLSAPYTLMAADAIEVTRADNAVGEVTSRGRLVSKGGDTLAAFTQVTRAVRSSRVLQIEVDLAPQRRPTGDPWDTYYCLRWAWGDEAADLYRSVHQTRQATTSRRFEGGLFVEIDTPDARTAILPGGHTWHRRIGPRMLDTLLLTAGQEPHGDQTHPEEPRERFTIGLGVDVSHPTREGIQQMAPPLAVIPAARPVAGPTAWLMNLDAKNVLVTFVEPLVDAETNTMSGLRLRLIETMGRGVTATLATVHPIRQAHKTDLMGKPRTELKPQEDSVRIPLSGHEFAQVEVFWA